MNAAPTVMWKRSNTLPNGSGSSARFVRISNHGSITSILTTTFTSEASHDIRLQDERPVLNLDLLGERARRCPGVSSQNRNVVLQERVGSNARPSDGGTSNGGTRSRKSLINAGIIPRQVRNVPWVRLQPSLINPDVCVLLVLLVRFHF